MSSNKKMGSSFLGVDLNSYQLTPSDPVICSSDHISGEMFSGACKLFFPDAGENTFHSILAVTAQDGKIIKNSNSYLIEKYPSFQDLHRYSKVDGTDIWSRLSITHNYLISNFSRVDETVEEEMYLLANPFSGSNIGHDFSILFHRIHLYRLKGFKMPVVVIDTMKRYPESLEACMMLLPETRFYFLPTNKIVKFSKLHIAENYMMDILHYRSSLIQELIQKAISQKPTASYEGKKIILMKTDLNKQVISSNTQYKCSKTIDNILVKKHGFLFLNPERTPLVDIILYLYHASKIVTSQGGIQYAHGIFFNPKINYICFGSVWYDQHKCKIITMSRNIDDSETERTNFIRTVTEG